ncbi:hypothetical protein TNCV_804131 [Trichonephila clavipes]|nr:hypothetical protein TNCV_804131 [Trichonephila clavipes]
MIYKSVRPPMNVPAHTIKPSGLLGDLSCTNIGLFRVSLSRHIETRLVSDSKLNQNSSVKTALEYDNFLPNLVVKQPTFFEPHSVLRSKEYTYWPMYIQSTLMKPISDSLAREFIL